MIRLGILSDVHATAAPVAEALVRFRQAGVARILCPGDIAGYGEELEATIQLLKDARCLATQGNHDRWYIERSRQRQESSQDYLAALPREVHLTVAGVRLYMVHAHPPDSLMGGIRLWDEAGEPLADARQVWAGRLAGFPYEVLVVGHTHQIIHERLAATLVINPGSSLFNHACGILTLPEMLYEVIGLSGRRPIKVWRWGQAE